MTKRHDVGQLLERHREEIIELHTARNKQIYSTLFRLAGPGPGRRTLNRQLLRAAHLVTAQAKELRRLMDRQRAALRRMGVQPAAVRS